MKDNVDGTVNKYKARLVAKGYHQQFGFYFKETFSPVVNWELQQIDINNEFLNISLQEVGYMTQSPDFE